MVIGIHTINLGHLIYHQVHDIFTCIDCFQSAMTQTHVVIKQHAGMVSCHAVIKEKDLRTNSPHAERISVEDVQEKYPSRPSPHAERNCAEAIREKCTSWPSLHGERSCAEPVQN